MMPAFQRALSISSLAPAATWVKLCCPLRLSKPCRSPGPPTSGMNPTIVLADSSFAASVENVVNAAFFSTGQKCTATSRVIVEEPIYDKFLEALIERTKKLKVGNGMEAGVDIGPAVDRGALDTFIRYCEIGTQEAGPAKIGGKQLTGPGYDKGYFFEPTIFAGVTPQMRIAQEEIFGPVLAVMKAKDAKDALRIANEIPFGLSSSIQTSSLSSAFDFVYGAQAGLLTVNLPSAGVEYQLPFGGTKDSSFGPKEQGPAAMEFYSDLKTIYLKY
jgi:acyl-CoA reductase-like NAD-dependent aldehyde dehydrogenase